MEVEVETTRVQQDDDNVIVIPDPIPTQELIQELDVTEIEGTTQETDQEETEVVDALYPPDPDPVSAPTVRKSTRPRTVPDRFVVGMIRAVRWADRVSSIGRRRR